MILRLLGASIVSRRHLCCACMMLSFPKKIAMVSPFLCNGFASFCNAPSPAQSLPPPPTTRLRWPSCFFSFDGDTAVAERPSSPLGASSANEVGCLVFHSIRRFRRTVMAVLSNLICVVDQSWPTAVGLSFSDEVDRWKMVCFLEHAIMEAVGAICSARIASVDECSCSCTDTLSNQAAG